MSKSYLHQSLQATLHLLLSNSFFCECLTANCLTVATCPTRPARQSYYERSTALVNHCKRVCSAIRPTSVTDCRASLTDLLGVP